MFGRPWAAFYRLICRHGRPDCPRRGHDKLLAAKELATRLSIGTIRDPSTGPTAAADRDSPQTLSRRPAFAGHRTVGPTGGLMPTHCTCHYAIAAATRSLHRNSSATLAETPRSPAETVSAHAQSAPGYRLAAERKGGTIGWAATRGIAQRADRSLIACRMSSTVTRSDGGSPEALLNLLTVIVDIPTP